MPMPESISEKLKLIDSKKNSLRNVILMLAMEWKGLDEQLDSTDQCVQGTLDELRIREDNLESLRESIRESNRELQSIQELVESRVEELEMREKEFFSFQKTQIEELKLKQEQLDIMRKLVDERIKEAELREERLNEQHESFEALLEKLKSEKEQLEHLQKCVGQRFEEIILKEAYFEGRARELDSIQNWIEARAKELDAKEEQIDDRANEVELEKELIRNLNEEHCRELELKERENYSAQNLNGGRSEELDSREKQLDAVQNYISESFKDFHSKSKQLKLDKKLFEERIKELEFKEKQLEERCKEVELRQEQFVNTSMDSHVKAEHVEDMMSEGKAEIQFIVTMDGRTLQLFLNERPLDDESMVGEVYRALQLSVDPAKLVLDAMEGFFPPHLKKGDVGFEENVVRRSCTVLLEQLMKISPLIKPSVKKDALNLAKEWKAKMKAVPANYLEVLGFLLLLASYKVASVFDADELLKLFAVVAEHNQAPDLCRVLGLTERVPDLIENFVKEKQELVAVNLSFGFGHCDKFPPVALLRRYLRRAKRVFKRRSTMGKESREAKDTVVDETVASIRAAIKCILQHNLESQISCKVLEKDIEQLLVGKQSNKRIRACLIKANNATKVTSSTGTPSHPKASASKLDPITHTMACILGNMDGKNLLLFLHDHLEEHEWLNKEIYDVLETSSDPGKFVLEAIQWFYPPHSMKGGIDIETSVIMRSCIFLLEILMRLSERIKPQVKEAAMKLAGYWEAKAVVNRKNSVAVLAFLLLVGAYGLAPAYDTDKLCSLFQTVAENRLAPQLSQALGFSEKVPVNNILDFRRTTNQSASASLELNSIVPSSSLGASHAMWGEVPACIQFASDPAKLILDSMLGCYYSNFKGNAIRAFNCLLSQLLRVPLEIKTHVKEEAMKFASDWKNNAKLRRPSEAWCFLLFLATYKGASCFDANELLDLLEIAYSRRQAIDVLGALGLADQASNFIRRLIQRKLYMDAIKYICGFSLVDEFPPTLLLEKHLSHAKEAAKNIREEGSKRGCFIQAWDKATRKEVDAIRTVINCIKLHGLESRYCPETLKTRIEELLSQQRSVAPAPAAKGQLQEEVDKRAALQSLGLVAQLQENDGRKRFPPSPHDSDAQTQQRSAKRVCRDPVSMVPPTQSLQQPYQRPSGAFAAETAPNCIRNYTHYSLSASSVVPAGQRSHISLEYGFGARMSGGFPPFGLVGTRPGSVPNFNAKPFTYAVEGTPHYSLSQPGQS